MARMIGYMVTWTTYGTWLQGDKRGYVKDGEVLEENKHLRESNIDGQQGETVRLVRDEREIVYKVILEEAKKSGQKIQAMAVCCRHVHVVAESTEEPIEVIVGRYKNAARAALGKSGFAGRVWTRGFDKRFCFDEEALAGRVKYVKRHGRDDRSSTGMTFEMMEQ